MNLNTDLHGETSNSDENHNRFSWKVIVMAVALGLICLLLIGSLISTSGNGTASAVSDSEAADSFSSSGGGKSVHGLSGTKVTRDAISP